MKRTLSLLKVVKIIQPSNEPDSFRSRKQVFIEKFVETGKILSGTGRRKLDMLVLRCQA